MGLMDLADLAANLPPGCALWRAIGGPMAWSDEVHALMWAEYRLRVLAWQKTQDGAKNRNAPKPIDPPPSVFDKREEEERITRRVEAYKRRTGKD